MWPDLTVLICTYNRATELASVMRALKTYLMYPGKVQYIICDDHSPDYYKQRILQNPDVAALQPRYVTTEVNSGWAANVNWGLAHCDTDYIFFIEDDYVVKTFIDLSLGVALMEHNSYVGMVRYRGTAGGRFNYGQWEEDISQHRPDYNQSIGGVPGRLTYLLIESSSPSLYIYSHGPHLKRRQFHDYYGAYPTGLKLGQTEESYAHIVKDKLTADINAPQIAILPDWIPMMFDHIGQSYQNTEFDK